MINAKELKADRTYLIVLSDKCNPDPKMQEHVYKILSGRGIAAIFVKEGDIKALYRLERAGSALMS